MPRTRFSVAAAALALGLARAEDILYVTDMPAYNVLVLPIPKPLLCSPNKD